jgi:hypothetical protein
MYGVLQNQIDGYTLFSYLLNDSIFLRLSHNWKYTKRGGTGRLDSINRFVPATFVCMSEARICISNIISRGLCNVQWFEVRSDCLFWYWRNCWQSLIKISFQNKKEGEGERYTLNCLNFLFIMKKRNHAYLIINIILTSDKWS